MTKELLQVLSWKAGVKTFVGLGLCSPYSALRSFWAPGNVKDQKPGRLDGDPALVVTNCMALTNCNLSSLFLK